MVRNTNFYFQIIPMSFILKPFDTVESISREDFKKNYLISRKPLIIIGLTKDYAWCR